MNLKARTLKQKEYRLWDDLISKNRLGNIHQTHSWGEFQAIREKGFKYKVIGIFSEEKDGIKTKNEKKSVIKTKKKPEIKDEENLIGGTLVLRYPLPAGHCWLYIPKGPIFNLDSIQSINEQLRVILIEIKKIAKEEKALFVRIEPAQTVFAPDDFGFSAGPDWERFSFKPAHAHYQPEHTLILSLNESEEQILKQMKPKGRYNIKLAAKKGVEVLIAGEKRAPSIKDSVSEFHRLLRETTDRDGFAGHSKEYYFHMLDKLNNDKVKLYLARFNREIIAGIIVTFYRDTAIYYFGASSNKHRNVMAPYLLQWEAIQDAKNLGFKWYDFLGTAKLSKTEKGFEYDLKHPWAGVTEFKLKFGGEKVDFKQAQELILMPIKYALFKVIKTFLLFTKRIFRK